MVYCTFMFPTTSILLKYGAPEAKAQSASSWKGLRSTSITCARREHHTAAGGLTLQAHPLGWKGSLRGRPGRPPATNSSPDGGAARLAHSPGPYAAGPGAPPPPVSQATPAAPPPRCRYRRPAHACAVRVPSTNPKASGGARPGPARSGTRGPRSAGDTLPRTEVPGLTRTQEAG